MQKEDKELVVAELTEKLRTAEILFVADYRGLTMPQIDSLRGKLLEHGAKFTVVKNTLTRRAAEAAYEAAAAQYQSTVLVAFQNVANALRALETDAEALRAQAETVELSRESLPDHAPVPDRRDQLPEPARRAAHLPAIARGAGTGAGCQLCRYRGAVSGARWRLVEP